MIATETVPTPHVAAYVALGLAFIGLCLGASIAVGLGALRERVGRLDGQEGESPPEGPR